VAVVGQLTHQIASNTSWQTLGYSFLLACLIFFGHGLMEVSTMIYMVTVLYGLKSFTFFPDACSSNIDDDCSVDVVCRESVDYFAVLQILLPSMVGVGPYGHLA